MANFLKFVAVEMRTNLSNLFIDRFNKIFLIFNYAIPIYWKK